MALITCPTCSYPFEGNHCPNPACEANPDVPESQKARRREENAKRKAEEAERERIREIRRRMS